MRRCGFLPQIFRRSATGQSHLGDALHHPSGPPTFLTVPTPLSKTFNSTHQRVSPSEDAVLVESLLQTAVSSLSLTPPCLKGLDHLLSGTDRQNIDIRSSRLAQDFSAQENTVWIGNLLSKIRNESIWNLIIFHNSRNCEYTVECWGPNQRTAQTGEGVSEKELNEWISQLLFERWQLQQNL